MDNDNRESAVNRRDWLLGAAGVSLHGWLPQLACQADETKTTRPKSCILLWMDGGPSQTHTFSIPDFEPDYKSIPTAVIVKITT